MAKKALVKIEPRHIAEIDRELKRGGLAFLKAQGDENGYPVKSDLGQVIVADGSLMNISVVVEGRNKWRYETN